MTNYERIEKAIHYLSENFREQPGLDEVARQVHLSPFHFQRLFTEWAGVSPKKFIQYLSIEYAKALLRQDHTLLETSFETGLSGSSRLHDLFINIEGMTPGEYRNQGEGLRIEYSFSETPFGRALVASTSRGICQLAFVSDDTTALENLRNAFANALFIPNRPAIHEQAMEIFAPGGTASAKLKLHLKGSRFQLKVWEALLRIPFAGVASYASIADAIEQPRANRAVASAIARNPVAFLIPCHRVIRSAGVTGQYHWGAARKQAILGWEASRNSLRYPSPQVSG